MSEKQGISFCIITGGQRPDRIDTLIKSIKAQSVPSYEILVCGRHRPDPGIIYTEKAHWADRAEVSKMRNFNAAGAQYDTIIILDDDVEFTPDWWRNIRAVQNFDILGCEGLDGNGDRWWDWQKMERGNPLAGPVLLDYTETDHDVYISGYFMMIKKQVWKAVKFDENRRNYQHDDVDFCHRALDLGYRVETCPKATVIHHVDARGREESERARTDYIKKNFSIKSDRDLGKMLLSTNYFREALPVFKKLSGADPSFENFYNLAYCFQQVGGYSNASKYYLEAIYADGNKDDIRVASAYLHMGEVFLKQGRKELALDCAKTATTLMPQNKKAVEMLFKLEPKKEKK